MTYIEIEDAIISLLEPLLSDGVKNISSYGGEFSPDSFGQVAIKMPSVFVAINGLEIESQWDVDIREYSISIYIVATNLRGEKDARHGVYSIADKVKVLLNRSSVVDLGNLLLSRESLIGYSRAVSTCVFQVEYKLPIDAPVQVL